MRRLRARSASLLPTAGAPPAAVLGVCAALALASCADRQPPPGAAGPAEAVQGFAAALSRGDAEAAWAMLSSRTQKAADERARAARAAAADAGPSSGKQMLFSSALRSGPIRARELSRSGDAAEVEATAADGGGGGGARFHAVREGGVWKVELPLGEP